MSNLKETVANARESTLTRCFALASAQLKDKATKNPTAKEYNIYEGCTTEAITYELAKRFQKEGFETKVKTTGILTTSWYLVIEYDKNHGN